MRAAEHLQPVPDLPDLDDFLCGDEPDLATPPPDTNDVGVVDRWLRRLARLQRREDEMTAQANDVIAQAQLWLSVQLIPIEKERAWLQLAVTQYHRSRLHREPQSKTIALPTGTLRSTQRQLDWEYTDVAAFIDWAKTNAPDLVRLPAPVVPPAAPDKNAAKKLLQLPDAKPGDTVQPMLDGELVPGVQVTVREPKFDIDLEGGDS